MRVVIVSTESRNLHTYTGGIGPRLEYLASELASRGHEVTFVTTTIHLDRAQRWEAKGVRLLVVDVGDLRTPLFPWLLARRVSSVVAALRPDVALAPEWGGLLAPLARDPRKPIRVVTNLATASRQIRHIEGRALPSRPNEKAVSLIRERIERSQARNSDRVFAISHAIQEWSTSEWGLEDVAVIPNGISIDDVRAEAEKGTSVCDGTGPSIVFAGRVSRWKGADVFGDALRELWRRGIAPECDIMGRVADDCVPLMRDLANEAQEAGGKVRVHGHVERRHVLASIASATVAVFPSRFEGFGNACLEAKALGTAVVATAGSGFDEFCTNGVDSLLVGPGDSHELAAAIEELLSDPARLKEIAAHGANSARDFDTRHYADRVERLLEEVSAA